MGLNSAARQRQVARHVLGAAVIFLVTGCDTRAPDPFAVSAGAGTAAPAAAPAKPTIVCPVDGARFVAGTGVVVNGATAGSHVELCSRGCSVRFAAEPERFAVAPATRR